MNRLNIKDKGLINKFLKFKRHELAVYSFENIFIWNKLFDITFKIIEDNLCVFFSDKIGAFLYLEPLGKGFRLACAEKVFKALNEKNKNNEISRIENVEEDEISGYKNAGYDCALKSNDYLCSQSQLSLLRGSNFKSKRAAYNFFLKNYRYEYLAFSLKHREECLRLYQSWMKQRRESYVDKIYQGMLEDSLISLKTLLNNYGDLNLTGRVVKIDGATKAFTFGFKLNKETFCILYEITDLSIKGLAQYVFRSFCAELKDFRFINVMDDSGLENLKQVKLSYKPVKLVPAYIIKNA